MTPSLYDFQPFTLVDYPGRVACTLFTAGCNLRCPYCHNADLIAPSAPPRVDETALFAFLKKRKGQVEGVCVTGGEPTLHDLSLLLRRIKAEGFAIKLDTNGTHPERWIPWLQAGWIDYIAMDIKAPIDAYAIMGATETDVKGISRSVDYLIAHAADYEFRVTIHPNWLSERDIRCMADWLDGAKRLVLQPYVPSDKVLNPRFCEGIGYSREHLEIFQEILQKKIDRVWIRGT